MSTESFPLRALQTVRQTRTMRLLVITICLFPLGYFFELFSSLAVGRSHFAYQLFEVLGVIYGWTLLSALVAFLVIGPFRPHTTFSLRGDCGQRALIFFVALAALLAIVVISAIGIARAIGGGVGGA